MEQHIQAVAAIAASIKGFYDRKEQFRINHGSTNSTRNQSFRAKQNYVDTSQLNNVISVSTEDLEVVVEPNVAMDRLVEATLKYDLIPLVVMDFPGITAGGGYSGTSGESSSFKHGFFDETVRYAEMVLANGEVVMCSDEERADLFHGAAGALGTMGVVTLLCIRLQPAKKYVSVTYMPNYSINGIIGDCEHAATNPNFNFVDAIIYSENEAVIIEGTMTNEKPYEDEPISTFSLKKDEWFYLHVKQCVDDCKFTEVIPLPDYMFRYDRGGFWVGKTTFDYFLGLLPFNKMTRKLLNSFMHTRMLYSAMHAQQYNIMVIQDVALPYRTANAFVDWTVENVGIFPLWLCPLKQRSLQTMHPHAAEYEDDGVTLQPMLNVGIWGFSKKAFPYDNWVKLNREIEAMLRDLGGMKWLYAGNLQSEDQFWSQFDRPWYDALREKYFATGLPSVFDKVKTDPEKGKQAMKYAGFKDSITSYWPLGGIHCMIKAWKSGAREEAKKSTWMNWKPKEEDEAAKPSEE